MTKQQKATLFLINGFTSTPGETCLLGSMVASTQVTGEKKATYIAKAMIREQAEIRYATMQFQCGDAIHGYEVIPAPWSPGRLIKRKLRKVRGRLGKKT